MKFRLRRLLAFFPIMVCGLVFNNGLAADYELKIGYTNDLLGYLEPCG